MTPEQRKQQELREAEEQKRETIRRAAADMGITPKEFEERVQGFPERFSVD